MPRKGVQDPPIEDQKVFGVVVHDAPPDADQWPLFVVQPNGPRHVNLDEVQQVSSRGTRKLSSVEQGHRGGDVRRAALGDGSGDVRLHLQQLFQREGHEVLQTVVLYPQALDLKGDQQHGDRADEQKAAGGKGAAILELAHPKQ